MRALLALAVLLAVPAAAQEEQPYDSSPEQYPGQLSRLRLEALYPALAPETERAPAADPSARLDGWLKDTAPALKNARGLTAYVHEGLRDPRGIDGGRQWGEGVRLLGEEIPRLERLAARGEEILRGPVPPRKRLVPLPLPALDRCVDAPGKPEFGSAEGSALQRALAETAYVCRLRVLIETKAWMAAGINGFGAQERAGEAALDKARERAQAEAARAADESQGKAREKAETRLGETPR